MSSISELKSSITFGGGLARNNQFLVTLPSLGAGIPALSSLGSLGGAVGSVLGFLGTRNMNILCRTAQIPGKQVLTHERRIGMEFQKVAYGYAVDDISMTFYLMNDYGVKDYFDSWRSTILDETGQASNYKNEYAKTVTIHQLRQPLKGFSRQLGPIRFNAGIGGGSVYSVDLIEAFPIASSAIELNNDLDGLVQLNVTFAYTNWRRARGVQNFINADIDTPLGGIDIL